MKIHFQFYADSRGFIWNDIAENSYQLLGRSYPFNSCHVGDCDEVISVCESVLRSEAQTWEGGLNHEILYIIPEGVWCENDMVEEYRTTTLFPLSAFMELVRRWRVFLETKESQKFTLEIREADMKPVPAREPEEEPEPQSSGFHHRLNGIDPPTARVNKIVRPPNSIGVYEAEIQVRIGNTDKWAAPSVSAFFPDEWPPALVLGAIQNAYNVRQYGPGPGEWWGMVGEYLKIKGRLNIATGSLLTAEPVYEEEVPAPSRN